MLKLSLKSIKPINRLQAILIAVIVAAVGISVVLTIMAAAAPPQVFISANNQANTYATPIGSRLAISWRTDNTATSCTASGGWSGTKNNYGGAEDHTGDTATSRVITYTLSCSNASGSTSASVTVTVGSGAPASTPTPTPTPAKPVVSLKANNTAGSIILTANSPLSIQWSATNNPSSCNASGNWSGSKAVAGGTEDHHGDTANPQTLTYTLTCNNAAGSTIESVTVSVTAAPAPKTKPAVALLANDKAGSFTVPLNSPLILKWSSSGGSCSAGGNWTLPSGANPLGGTTDRSSDTRSARTLVYSWTCSNSYGQSSASINVTVAGGSPVNALTKPGSGTPDTAGTAPGIGGGLLDDQLSQVLQTYNADIAAGATNTITSNDGIFSIELPPGALLDGSSCQISTYQSSNAPTKATKLKFVSKPYGLNCQASTGDVINEFKQAAKVKLNLTPAQLKGFTKIGVYQYDLQSSRWKALAGAKNNGKGNFEFELNGPAQVAVLGETAQPIWGYLIIIGLILITLLGVGFELLRRKRSSKPSPYLPSQPSARPGPVLSPGSPPAPSAKSFHAPVAPASQPNKINLRPASPVAPAPPASAPHVAPPPTPAPLSHPASPIHPSLPAPPVPSPSQPLHQANPAPQSSPLPSSPPAPVHASTPAPSISPTAPPTDPKVAVVPAKAPTPLAPSAAPAASVPTTVVPHPAAPEVKPPIITPVATANQVHTPPSSTIIATVHPASPPASPPQPNASNPTVQSQNVIDLSQPVKTEPGSEHAS